MALPFPQRVGVAGFGFWGTKLARNIAESPSTRLVAVCDPSEARRQAAAAQYVHATVVSELDQLLATPHLDAVVLATPESAHHEGAIAALEHGKHVLVEKPLALSADDCIELEEAAAARGLTLMVGHTFLYSAPVRLLRELVVSGELGSILYCYSQRLNLGAIRGEVSAMWDLAPHDLSILLYVLAMEPRTVSAQQFSLIDEPVEDVAMINLGFRGGTVGHVHVSRLDPRKVRQLVVVGDAKMAVYDDLDAEMPVKLYDKGVVCADDGGEDLLADAGFGRHRVELRSGDVVAPKVTGPEPLREEIEHFAECIATGRAPLTDAASGRAVVAVLEAAQASSARGGRLVLVNEEPSRAYTAA